MSLAWAAVNRATPDLRSADEYARRALALVPHWRYVRDILLPVIHRAAGGAPGERRELADPPASAASAAIS